MTFTVQDRNRETYFDSIEVQDQLTVTMKKRTLKQFSQFCQARFKQSDESIISELLKQKTNDMTVNSCDLLQQYVNFTSKKLSPSTIKIYLSHVRTYLNYRGIKLSSQDMASVNFPREVIEEKYPLSKDDIRLILDNSNYQHKTLYLTLASSLMRIGEACQLRKKDFDTTKERIVIHIPPKIAKFKKARTTFISKEAYPYVMKRLSQIEDNDLVFGSSESKHNSTINEEEYFSRRIDKLFPHLERYSTNRRKISLHSFRAFGITKAVRTVGDSFACILAGQKGYLSMYKRFTEEEKLQDYLKLEPEFFIYENFGVSDESKNEEIELLKSDMKDMKRDLKILLSGMKEEIKKNESS